MSEAKAEENKDDVEQKKEAKKPSKGQKKKDRLKKKKEGGEGQSALAKLAAAKAAKHKEDEEKRKTEEDKRRIELELEEQKRKEEERKRKEEEDRRIAELKAKYQADKEKGLILTKKQLKDRERLKLMREDMKVQVGEQKEEEKAPQEEAPQKTFKVNSKKNKKKGHKAGDAPKDVPKDAPKDAPKETATQPLPSEAPKPSDKSPEKDVDWEDLAKNPDKIDDVVKPKLSIDEKDAALEQEHKEAPAPATQEKHKMAENVAEQPKVSKVPKMPKKVTAEEEKKIPDLRSPILCVLGHVDTGKTKLLDKIRKTKVQEGEVGGITQQIGATFFPRETLEEHAATMKGIIDLQLRIPGLLIIDTPGHESFSNLRNRGSSLCDFAVLLVDIMHGLENQTIESINILKKRKIPFVVALNKIDRCYNWKGTEYASSKLSFEKNPECKQQFMMLTNKVIAQFAEQEINACLYWENNDPETFVSLVPTSAITGEGIPDILTYLVKRVQETLSKRIVNSHKLLSTVMEVKVAEGYGVTCDVILVTGELHVDDTIVVSGFEGPIVTTIRALLTPQPLREMRVKGEYIHHESVCGTMGVKLCAPGLEEALAGSPVYKADTPEEVEEYKKLAGEELAMILRKFLSKTGEGVYVQSSTLGSLEALLELLKSSHMPVSGVGLGPIYKRHILKVLKAVEKKGEKEEYATILAFEVEPDKEAKELADKNKIKIFSAKIVYHLVDSFKVYAEECLYKIVCYRAQAKTQV